MQEDIVDHLREIYKPDAIILHGSRARGKERASSDWDFIFLYNNPVNTPSGRKVYKDQNIEFSSFVLPIAVEDVENEFSTKLQEAKVVYESNGEGTDLLDKANIVYREGVYWSPEKISNHKLWIQGRIDGMRDHVDDDVIFNK